MSTTETKHYRFFITIAENGYVVRLGRDTPGRDLEDAAIWVASDADELGRIVLSALASERLS